MWGNMCFVSVFKGSRVFSPPPMNTVRKIGCLIQFIACFAIYDIFLPNFEKMLNCNLLRHEILVLVIGILTR